MDGHAPVANQSVSLPNPPWIAAQTIKYGYGLLTLNRADFAGLPALRLLTMKI